MSDYDSLFKTFQKYDQAHVFKFIDELTDAERSYLLKQAESIDLNNFSAVLLPFLKKITNADIDNTELNPPEVAQPTGKQAQIGENALRNAQIGMLTVAGGQATRLNFPKPKGCYPIMPITNRTIFEVFARRMLGITKKYRIQPLWAIMTSEDNHEQTTEFFAKNNYFGLNEKRIFFFKQQMLPSISADGKLLLSKKHEIAMNPNGHGGALESFYKSDVFKIFLRENAKHLSYFQVDNIQAKFEDPYFIGLHIDSNSEFSSKIVEKTDPNEKVGLFVKSGNDLRVVEYSDLAQQYQILRNPDDSLLYNAANIAIHLIDMNFVRQLVESDEFGLPYHAANKTIPYINDAGKQTKPHNLNAYKFEKFIFDALVYAKNPIIMQVNRNEDFLPLKNAKGSFSPAFIQSCYQEFWVEKLEEIGVIVVQKNDGNLPGKIEIDPSIILNLDDLKHWVDSHGLKIWTDGNIYIG